MLRLEARPQTSKFWSYASPLLALLVTVVIGVLMFTALGKDPVKGLLVFFWDPFEPQPHDPDIKALLRVAAVWNIPVACNECSADYLLSSPLMDQAHEHRIPDYATYLLGRG